jgi:hypothetical protein
MGPEVTAAAMDGQPERLIGKQLGQARAQPLMTGDRREIGVGLLILGGEPRACLGRVHVFEPAIGIGDLHAVVCLDDGGATCRRIGEGGRRAVRRRCGDRGRRAHEDDCEEDAHAREYMRTRLRQ